jgi:hypothetical protein
MKHNWQQEGSNMSVDKTLKSRLNLNRPSQVKKSTNSPLSKIVTETRKDPPKISDADIFRKELVEIAEKSKILSLLEEQEKILVKEEEYKIFQEKKEEDHKIIQEKLTSPFTKNKNVDMKPAIEYAIDKLLPKAYIPEVIEYPEPFQEEPALNRELAEFKKKINTHIHQVGFAGSGGGGIGDIADAGDIDGGTALVNGKFLKYDSSSQKFVGSDAVSNEALQDVVGGMITNNTETNISVTYDDTTGTLDFVVGTLNQDTTGTAATVTGAAQTNITSVGTLTALQVDNLNLNGNTLSSTAGTDLLITPLSGQQIVLDGTIVIDAGVVTGATSVTSTAFVGDITGDVTGNADTATALATARNIAGQSFDGTGNIAIASTDLSNTSAIALLTATQTLTNKTITSPQINTQIDMLARAELRFQDATGGQFIAFEAPATVGSSVTFVLPDSDGSNGQFLKTDGSGTLSFAAASVSALAADNISAGDAAINLTTSSGNITIDAAANNSDIILKGTDGGGDITALTLDMSDAGTAIFNNGVLLKSVSDAAILQDSANLFIVLDSTNGSANAGDNLIMDASAESTDVGDDILHEDFAYMHTGMQREILEIRTSGGRLLKSMSGFAAGAV